MSTRYRGTLEERRALDTYTRLMRGATSVGSRLDRRLRGEGITEPQFGVLEMLYHLGPLRPQEITARHFTTGPNTSYLLTVLEGDGFVVRGPDPKDGRATLVTLTAKGRRRVEGVLPGHVAAIVREFAILTPAEQDELGRLARIVGTRERSPRERVDPEGPPRGGVAPEQPRRKRAPRHPAPNPPRRKNRPTR